MATARIPNQVGPKERFFRYFQHEATALQEQMARLEDTAMIGGERTDAVDHCLAGIARLQKEVSDASSYVPAYDQRTYSEAIKALGQKLEETRATFAPRPKFTFRTNQIKKNPSAISLSDAAELASAQRRHIPGYRSTPVTSNESSIATTPQHPETPPNEAISNFSAVNTGNLDSIPESPTFTRVVNEGSSTLDSHSAAIRKPSFASSTSITISSQKNVHIILPSSASHATSSGSLTNLRHCVVDMSVPTSNGQPFAGLTIKNVKESLLVCGIVNGAAHITDLEKSTIVVASRQVRMHECRDCVVYLRCSSRPIIEDCSGIRFAPLPIAYGFSSFHPGETDQWDKVDDFKWLKAQHSPNWSVLPPQESVPSEVWRDVVPGSPGLKLDDILKATKVLDL